MNKLLFLSIIMVLPVFGEFRIWEDTKGKSIEAEYISEQSGKVVLKLRNEKTIRVNPATLSAKDREYANQRVKPRLELDIDKEEVRVSDPNLVLAFNNEVRLTAEIEKKSTRSYGGELTAHFIFIGDNERSNHETIVKKSTVKFTLDKETTLNEKAAFASERASFLKSAHHSFEGYLLVITDAFGEIVVAESKPTSYKRYAAKLMALNEGAEFNKDFSAVDLNSEKTARAEAAEPNTWLYGMGRGDLGFPQKSPDGTIARIQTRNKEAFLIHFRYPINLKEFAKNNDRCKEINAVITFKLTEGKIGVSGSSGHSHMIPINDEETHVLEIVSQGENVTFVLDGATVEKVDRKKGKAPNKVWHLGVDIAERARLEITSLDYQK